MTAGLSKPRQLDMLRKLDEAGGGLWWWELTTDHAQAKVLVSRGLAKWDSDKVARVHISVNGRALIEAKKDAA